MAEGDQEQDQNHNHIEDKRHAIRACISIFFIIIGVVALTLWLVYRPRNPKFTVVGAAVYDVNMSSSSLLSTAMQFTIITRNPSKRVSIYYDDLTAFVLYRNQLITSQVMLPPLFNDKKSTVMISPMLVGRMMTVAYDVANELVTIRGGVWLRVVLSGRVRWKVELARPINIGYYTVYVKCDVLVDLKRGSVGSVLLFGPSTCNVDI